MTLDELRKMNAEQKRGWYEYGLADMPPSDRQVGGDHYKNLAIQPLDYIMQNQLDYIQGNIVKYATRYPHKGQARDDLNKIIHYAQLALERL